MKPIFEVRKLQEDHCQSGDITLEGLNRKADDTPKQEKPNRVSVELIL
jgi:hypothetical protein